MRALSLLVLCAALGAGAPVAVAQQAAPAASQPASPAAGAGAAAPAAGGARWGDGRTSTDPRQQPAHGSPYRWRQMGLAVVLMGLMLAFLVWLVRRATRGRP